MDLRNCKQDALRSLAQASTDPKRLALIHVATALLLSLALTIFSNLLSGGIDNTGGLSGIGTRSALMAGQSFLSLALTIALPFWDIGFVYVGLSLARGKQAEPMDLLEGFRRFGKVLRLMLLQLVIFVAIGTACLYISTILFAMTPYFGAVSAMMEPYLTTGLTGTTFQPDAQFTAQFLEATVPMYLIFGVLFTVVSVPLFYRFRMAQLAIMDEAPGALAALLESTRMMRKNCLSLFKVDLSLWWFYAAQVFLSVLAYGDMILPLLGVNLPVDGTVLFYGFYIAHILLQILLVWRTGSFIQTTYAHCYLRLKTATPPPPQISQPTPKMPW